MAIQTIHQIEYHRNGISGEGFYAVTFTDDTNGEFLAVVFPPDPIQNGDMAGEPDWGLYERGDWDNPRVALFEVEQLPNVTFGQNSWRGDNYAADLYAAIKEHAYA